MLTIFFIELISPLLTWLDEFLEGFDYILVSLILYSFLMKQTGDPYLARESFFSALGRYHEVEYDTDNSAPWYHR